VEESEDWSSWGTVASRANFQPELALAGDELVRYRTGKATPGVLIARREVWSFAACPGKVKTSLEATLRSLLARGRVAPVGEASGPRSSDRVRGREQRRGSLAGKFFMSLRVLVWFKLGP